MIYRNEFKYDANGNILSKMYYVCETCSPSFILSYNYLDSTNKNKLSRLITPYNGNVYDITYDDIGNPISYKGYSFSYEVRSLKTITGNGKNISFEYNDSGIRTSKTVNGSKITYELLGSKIIGQARGENEKLYFNYDEASRLVSLTYFNGSTYNTYFYVLNILGDVVGLVDSQGNVVVTYLYDAYGNIISSTNQLSFDLAKLNPFRYRGYYYDEETSLYYLNSRYYNPEIGRFINADDPSILSLTHGEILGANLYAYCGNNPVMGYDPTGYLDWGSIGKGSGWLVVGISAVVIGASVLTCGVATPLMVGIAVATIGAGALTTINGIAEVGEGFTDYNFMKDGVFQGNESAYNTYSTITSTTATFGSLICGGWMALNKPRIQAYNNVGNYNFSGTLSDAQHMSRPFQSSTLAQKE